MGARKPWETGWVFLRSPEASEPFCGKNGWGGGLRGRGGAPGGHPPSLNLWRDMCPTLRLAAFLEVEAHTVFSRVDFAGRVDAADGFGHLFGAVGVVGEAFHHEVFEDGGLHAGIAG